MVNALILLSSGERHRLVHDFLKSGQISHNSKWIAPEDLPFNNVEAMENLVRSGVSNGTFPDLLIVDNELAEGLSGSYAIIRMRGLIPTLSGKTPTIFFTEQAPQIEQDAIYSRRIKWSKGEPFKVIEESLKRQIVDLVDF